MKKIITILIIAISFNSCDILQDVLNETTATGNAPLTEQEVINGLKQALEIGTDSVVAKVTATDGFFKDNVIKILLPPEAKVIMDNKDNSALKAIGITKLIDDVILRINRAAEDASKSAKPIFVDAIKKMSITDAFKILNGPDNAATEYFKKTTSKQLFNAFKPKVKSSLDKPLVAGISTNKAWNSLTSGYNKVAQFTSWNKINTNLDDYVTQKAIDGLFVKLAEKEKNIRKNPAEQVTDLLKRVFGGK